jgi:hypothetical protein
MGCNDVTVSAYAAWLISSSASARARNEMHYLGETAENVSADVELLCRESNTIGRVEDFDWNCCAYTCACFSHNEYPFHTIAIHYPCTPFTLPQSGICHTLVVGGSLTFQDYACCFCCCCYRRRRTRPLKRLQREGIGRLTL